MFRGEDESYILNIISLGISMGVVYGSVDLIPHIPSTSGEDGAGTSEDGELMELGNAKKDIGKQLEKLNEDLNRVSQAFSRDREVEGSVVHLFRKLQSEAQNLATNAQSDDALLRQLIATIDEIYAISSKSGIRFEKQGHVRVDSASSLIDHLLKQPAYQQDSTSKIQYLKGFEERFKGLPVTSQRRLFCFSVFPEGSIVRKQVLMHWWIGEHLLQSEDPEFDADEMLSYYCKSGFIEPAMGEGKVVGFKMDLVIRYVVIYLAERKGFMDFDFSWRPTGNFSYSKKACLLDTEEGSNSKQLMGFDNPQKLQTLFYVSGRSHVLTPKWFSSIRNVKIICLGRWEFNGKEEEVQEELEGKEEDIEEELEGNEEDIQTCQKGDDKLRGPSSESPTYGPSIKFLQGLKYLKNLKFLSLEGFHRMSELPVAARTLKNLNVLNLKDCKRLATLPNDIGLLKHLTHLDISGCQGLKFMPKGLKQLTALQVLKGFVTGNRYEGRLVCKLDDLVGLKKLKKLSVIIRNRTPEHLLAVKRFPSLKILRISWDKKVDGINGLESSMQWLPPGLEKLDLRRIRTDAIHFRVMPEKLKKLYIIDAYLCYLYLGPADLRILRLPSSSYVRMNLMDIIDKLPQLIYCKVVGCSQIEESLDRMMKEKGFHKLDESSPAAWVKTILNYENLKQDLGFKWSFLLNCNTSLSN